MYMISNRERRELLRLLAEFRALPTPANSLKGANLRRVAGLLKSRLERRPCISVQQSKQIKLGL